MRIPMSQTTADGDRHAPAEVSHHGPDTAAERLVPGPCPATSLQQGAAAVAAPAPPGVCEGRGAGVPVLMVTVVLPEQGARVAAPPAVVEERGGPPWRLARRPAQRPRQSQPRVWAAS